MTKDKNKKSKKSLAGKIKCPDCKEIIDEGLIFCPECGNRVPPWARFNPDSSLSV